MMFTAVDDGVSKSGSKGNSCSILKQTYTQNNYSERKQKEATGNT